MKKTHKKIEKALVQQLTAACETLLDSSKGFCWLTHHVNFNTFPDSLRVICVYESDDDINQINISQVQQIIAENLESIDIRLKNRNRQILFESEENCTRVSDGIWRLHIDGFLLNRLL
ncbi:MAG: Fis family transcriptional regulator [Gammaproteobacteria bacterium]|nr:Fis family transcriptional regulator [Gammaproteobacteria bacterium]